MVLAAQDRPREHLRRCNRAASASRAIEGVRSALLNALMRPAGVVVVAVQVEDALKVLLPKNENMRPSPATRTTATGISIGRTTRGSWTRSSRRSASAAAHASTRARARASAGGRERIPSAAPRSTRSPARASVPMPTRTNARWPGSPSLLQMRRTTGDVSRHSAGVSMPSPHSQVGAHHILDGAFARSARVSPAAFRSFSSRRRAPSKTQPARGGCPGRPRRPRRVRGASRAGHVRGRGRARACRS
jgi:hypothetical protein